MKLQALLLGFVGISLIAGMILFAAASSSSQVIDSNNQTYNSMGNATNTLVSNTTAVAGAGTGGLVIVLAGLGMIAGIVFLMVMTKSR